MWVMYWIVCDVKVFVRKNYYEKYWLNDILICIVKKVGVLFLLNNIVLFNVIILYDILIVFLIILELLCISLEVDGFLRV